MKLSDSHRQILDSLAKSPDYVNMTDLLTVDDNGLHAILIPTDVKLHSMNLGLSRIYPAVHIDIREAWAYEKNPDGSYNRDKIVPKNKVEYEIKRLAGSSESGRHFDECHFGEVVLDDLVSDGKRLLDLLLSHAKATCTKLEIEEKLHN